MAYNADVLDASCTPEELAFQEETTDTWEQKLLYEAMRKERAVTKKKCKSLIKGVSSYLNEDGTLKDDLPPEVLSLVERVSREVAEFMAEINSDFMEFVGVCEEADRELTGHQQYMSDWETVVLKLKPRTHIEPPSTPQSPTVPYYTFLEKALLSQKLKPSITLPKLTLEPFDGQLGTYKTFKETFNSLVGELDASELFKAKYLKDYLLKNEALDRVKHVSIHHPNATEQIWELLDERYSNSKISEHILTRKLYQINHFQKCKNDVELKFLYDHVYDLSHKLRELTGKPESGEDAKVILHTLLTSRLQHKATKLLNETPDEYTLDNLLKLIKTQLDHNESNSLFSGLVHAPSLKQSCNNSPSDSSCKNSSQEFCPQNEPIKVQSNHLTTKFRSTLYRNRNHDPRLKHHQPYSNYNSSFTNSSNNNNPFEIDYSRHSFRSTSFKKTLYDGTLNGMASVSNFANVTSFDPCCFCSSKSHTSHYCSSITSPSIFFGLCKEKNRCKNCLEIGHIAYHCRETSFCDRGCNLNTKHSRIVCPLVNSPSNCKVFVGGLPQNIRKDDLENIFLPYGLVRGSWISRFRGFAFVTFDNSNEARAAVEGLKGSTIWGCECNIQLADGRRKRQSDAFNRNRYTGGFRSRNVQSESSCFNCGGRGHYALNCWYSGERVTRVPSFRNE